MLPTHFPFRASSIATACALSGLIPCAIAQAQNTEAPVTQLQDVVVTASGFEQAIAEAPASISVITQEQLEGKYYRDITDALQDIPGVSIEGGAGGKIESTKIVIRGMSEDYVLMLVDGKPLGASSEAYYNGFGGGAQTSWMPPMSAIERIEVIRGPMSSLYGSSALGGVINVITKKVPTEWTGSVTVDGLFQGDSDAGNAYQGRYYLSGPLIENRLAMTLYGSKFRRLEDDIQGGYAGKDRIDNAAKFAWKLNDQHSLTLEGSHARNKNDRTLKSSTGDSMMHNKRTVYGLTHDWRWGQGAETKTWVLNEKVDIINGGNESGYRATTFNTKTVVPFDTHMLTVGAEYKQEKTMHEPSRFINSVTPNLERWQAALFAEDEWSVTDRLALTGGVRLDKNEHFGTHFTPRLYGVYRLTDNLNLKGGVSGGYKTPSLKQADDGIVEPAGRGRGWDQGNTNLQPEKSTNFELGFAYASPEKLNFGVMAYYTRFKDKIDRQDVCRSPASAPTCMNPNDPFEPPREYVAQYQNVDSATLRGIEASFGMPLTPSLLLNTNYTFSDSEIKSGPNAGQALNNTPRHMFNVGLDYQVNHDFKLWTKIKYKSKSIEGGEEEIPAYTLVDLGLTYQFNKHVMGFAGIYNAFDKEINTDEGFGKRLDGRRYYAGLTIEY